MSFEEKLREKISNSTMGSDRRNLFKLVLGEWQQLAAKQTVKDEHGENIAKKIIESNEKSIGYLKGDDVRAQRLQAENLALRELLPRYLSKQEILAELAANNLAIKSFGNDGQAIGAAMKYFKSTSQPVEGDTVKQAVLEFRAE